MNTKTLILGFILIFVLMSINNAGAQPSITISITPSGQHISENNEVKFSINTNVPTTAEVDCGGSNKGEHNTLSTSHLISVGKFSVTTSTGSPRSIICTIKVWDNESNTNTETRTFNVYSQTPYLAISDSSSIHETVKFTGYRSQCISKTTTAYFHIENNGLSPMNSITLTKNVDWITLSTYNIASIAALEKIKILVTINVGCDSAEELSSTITINTNNAGSATVKVKVEVDFPIGLEEVSENGNFGKLTSGKSNTKTFTIKEKWGYKRLNTVEIKLENSAFKQGFNAAGILYPKLSASTLNDVGTGGKTFSLSFDVPLRGTKPYNAYKDNIIVRYKNEKKEVPISFEIPSPEMEVSKLNFNFPDIESKNDATENFKVREKSGHTTLDNFEIKINKCTQTDSGKTADYPDGIKWIKFDDIQYISPGESKNIKLSIDVPDTYKTANYEWSGVINANYVESKNIVITGIACEPFIKDNIKKLENIHLSGSPDNLRQNIISLLNNMCAKRILMSNANTVTNSAKTLLESLNNAQKYNLNSDYNQLIAEFNRINNEFNGLKKECKSLEGTYSGDVENIQKSADNAIKEVGTSIAELHEKEAKKYENNNYKKSLEHYRKCYNISGLTKSEKAVECSKGTDSMLNKYNNAIHTANSKIKKTEQLQNELNNMVWFDGSDYKFISRISDYNLVGSTYHDIVLNYDEASQLYNKAGEEENASLFRELLIKKQNEKSKVESITMMVGVILVIILLIFIFITYLTFINERLRFLNKGIMGFILLFIILVIFALLCALYLSMLYGVFAILILIGIIISILRYNKDTNKIKLFKIIKP